MADKIQEIMNMPEFDLQNFSVIGALLCVVYSFTCISKSCSTEN